MKGLLYSCSNVLNVFEVEGGVASRLGLQHQLHNDACVPYICEDKLFGEVETHLVQDQNIIKDKNTKC